MTREMTYEPACAQVMDYAAGSLAQRERSRFEAHLADCEECRQWLATRQLLVDQLSCSHQAPSLSIARLAADAESLDPAERERIETHLETCAACRQELELTRGALRRARRDSSLGTLADRLQRFPGLPLPFPFHRQWVAASLVLLSVVLVWMAWTWRGPAATVRGASSEEPQILQADRQLILQDLRVQKGARLVARATESVVLGNGFVVESGGALAIELGSSKHPILQP